MTQHTLNALKGWPFQHALDYVAEFAETVADFTNGRPVLSGSVVHLNPAGFYELGVGTAADPNMVPVMPLFVFPHSDDPDVINASPDPATERGGWYGVNPTGQVMALPAAGAFELASTEFVPGTYYPNDALTSPLATDPLNSTEAGKIMKGTYYVDMVLGCVSRGVGSNGYNHPAIAFWPQFIPPMPATTTPPVGPTGP